MKKIVRMALCAALACTATTAKAKLQNIEVGGSITILGEYFRNVLGPFGGVRYLPASVAGRPIGTGGAGVVSATAFSFDDRGPGLSLVSQWTRLHVDADFTDDVRAFVEFDSAETWGTNFRDSYIFSANAPQSPFANDVDVYQAYIETNDMFDHPLRLRIGRQELRFGSEWLVGAADDGPAPAWGLSFDAIRATYKSEEFTLDAWWSKLVETSPAEEDGDTDFYGVYGTYKGIEGVDLNLYWLYVRDAIAISDTTAGIIGTSLESVFGVDDYDTTQLHTVGFRAGGAVNNFDFEAEIAYQWGDAGTTGMLYSPLTYGDNDAEYDNFGANLELGYTFSGASWSPRAYAGYTYLGGEDNRGLSFGDWLGTIVNPWHRPEASVSFSRLFSNWAYSGILDGPEFTNAHILRVGLSATPRESIELTFDVAYFLVDEPFDAPITFIPLFPSFMTNENDDELGWELSLGLTYQYSEDLSFSVGWSHLFVGDGLEDGSFNNLNGNDFSGGIGDDDADYFSFETGIEF
ncbi:MAG: alginate export family protein [Candidatus Hydrogenedentes bacterium]|jgi:hypothetical protein|nr:alginate export family protein [Candidatus Hydrogenedentota bacterium]